MIATPTNDQERRLLEALAGMVDQYLGAEHGELDHMSMIAGERATKLLAEYGLVTEGTRNARWTEEGERLLAAL